jgi:hypothetical protein
MVHLKMSLAPPVLCMLRRAKTLARSKVRAAQIVVQVPHPMQAFDSWPKGGCTSLFGPR